MRRFTSGSKSKDNGNVFFFQMGVLLPVFAHQRAPLAIVVDFLMAMVCVKKELRIRKWIYVTENSATNVWNLNSNNGNFNNNNKTNENSVRPVSALDRKHCLCILINKGKNENNKGLFIFIMVRDEDMFEAFRACLRHKASSPSAIKYFPHYQRDLLKLVDEINSRTYRPSTSITFVVTKPKLREVFAAGFRDRIVHHYVALRTEPLLEKLFCDRTFNCRVGKGVMFGVNMLKNDIKECSNNYTNNTWVVKFDLRGFFMSIDVKLLNSMLKKFLEENYFGEDKEDVLWLTELIMLHEPEKDCEKHSPEILWKMLPKNKSLFTNGEGMGLPIGNLPSQHNANFLLHWFDMFIEKRLGYKHHGRYVDDGYYMMECKDESDRKKMLHDVCVIRRFLSLHLHVTLHPDKFSFQHYSKGVPFTGAIVKNNLVYVGNRTVGNAIDAIYRLNRFSNTDKKLLKNIQSINSYLGTMRHYNTYAIRRRLVGMISKNIWQYIYVKGKFYSIHIKKGARVGRMKKVEQKDYPKIVYRNDPIDFSLLEGFWKDSQTNK